MSQTIEQPRRSGPFGRATLSFLLPLALACASDAPPESPPEPTGESGGEDIAANGPYRNEDWWPDRLDLRVLQRHGLTGDPTDEDFDYAEAFAALDFEQLKEDIEEVLTTSQDWWPADYGTTAA
tara:strand:- start:1958 stop:2329 length:372 start_codon:yes stop_codon:yes gene_type:complete